MRGRILGIYFGLDVGLDVGLEPDLILGLEPVDLTLGTKMKRMRRYNTYLASKSWNSQFSRPFGKTWSVQWNYVSSRLWAYRPMSLGYNFRKWASLIWKVGNLP